MTTNKKTKLRNLSSEDKIAYKAFFGILIKMGRDTKLVLKHNPKLTLSEFPHLTLLTKNSIYVSIYYSVEENCWMINKAPNIKEKFNPTAITGILEFISDFHINVLLNAIETTSNYIKILIETYVDKENTQT